MMNQPEYIAEIIISSLMSMTLMLLMGILGLPIIIHNTKYDKATFTMKAVKMAFLWSLLPASLLIITGTDYTINTWEWFHISTFTIYTSVKIDYYAAVFLPVALYVTWSILQFALWYMEKDHNIDQFFKYLLIFLISMIILVTANNLFQLFIGWEGVGIMSFLLISWWFGRPDANSAALQAVLYNRAGDLGLFIMMAWTMASTNSWELDNIFFHSQDQNMNIPALALILAAAGKSAQFGLHPWLPSAMEGPTPVSALLHSSTMVVAGIFLLIRFYPLIEQSKMAMSTCLWLGSLTTLFTAACALTQNDIKKIIAFSTSSQLGFMMVTIGLGQPRLAFLHICTHAFFKAMLFMCSGVIIHCLKNEQDIRKMGGMYFLTPLTASCITLGSLALTGTPFLSGFYSKDAIIEALNSSHLNACALSLTLIATSFTAIYSLRILYYVLAGQPRFNPLSPINENDPNLNASLMRLAVGSLIFGQFITMSLPPKTTSVLTLTPTIKMAAVLVTLAGLAVALLLTQCDSLHKKLWSQFQPPFTTLLGFFPLTIHRLLPKLTLYVGHLVSSQLIDQTWFKLLGPKAILKSSMSFSKYINTIQLGLIKLHLMSFTIALLTTIFIYSMMT
nr:NADH dehydrogenase subunit 5 [Cynoglossus abbreviatus]ACT80253.1 NADH dehydrogenase subunit 5 [Cynoglossus abbreviatus]